MPVYPYDVFQPPLNNYSSNINRIFGISFKLHKLIVVFSNKNMYAKTSTLEILLCRESSSCVRNEDYVANKIKENYFQVSTNRKRKTSKYLNCHEFR